MFRYFSWQPCLLPLAGLALLSATPLQAETVPYQYIALVEGDCQGVTINGHPLSGLCGQTLMNTLYTDGRTSFGFILNNKAVISFSGNSDSQPAPDHYHMDVDQLTVIAEAGSSQPQAATGYCDVLGDITKSARITCTAGTVNKDQYFMSFKTTAPPDIAYGK